MAPAVWFLLLASVLAAPPAAVAGTVVLDTGHTPQRPGSVSPGGLPEYGFNLRLTNAVARWLAADRIPVVRVAADGRDLSLAQRTAGTAQADLFVSIHHDSIPQDWINQGRRREFSGFAVLVSAKNLDYPRSLRCGQVMGEALLIIGEHPSLYHAVAVKGENRPLVDRERGVHRFDDLVVLKTARAPAVLVEAGVIANPDEADRLAMPATANRLGYAIATAIYRCLFESAPSPTPTGPSGRLR